MKNKKYKDYRSKEYLEDMKEYISNLHAQNPQVPEAVRHAREMLIKSGITDRDGRIRKRIVSRY